MRCSNLQKQPENEEVIMPWKGNNSIEDHVSGVNESSDTRDRMSPAQIWCTSDNDQDSVSGQGLVHVHI